MALDFLAGCVGGCAGLVVGHPLDTIKVRLQTQDFRNPLYKGTFDCFRKTIEKESVRGLYKGMSSPMAGVAVVNAIIFGVYGNMQRNMSNSDSLVAHFTAGAAAGLAQSVVASPMELVKTRIQLQQESTAGSSGSIQKYRNPFHCMQSVYRAEGLRGVFRGQLITIFREIPGLGSYFMSYELLTRWISGPSKKQLNTPSLLFAGGMAGCISWILTYPIDVIKSRLQADTKYTGIIDCFKKSVKDEGFKFLSRGLSSTMIRSFPTNAATFATVTWVLRIAGVEEAVANSDNYISASEFNDDMLRIALGAAPAIIPNASFMVRRVARADRDALSVNGEEGEEAARRNLVASAGTRLLGTLERIRGEHFSRDVESATFELL